MTSMAARVRQILNNAFRDYRRIPQAATSYQEAFAEEGRRKTEYIVNDLLSLHGNGSINAREWAVVSVGGADGSDVANILTQTEISHGVLLEFADEGVVAARNKAQDLYSRGKHMLVLGGDAGQRWPDALEKLRNLKDAYNLAGIVVIFLAVLHELPTRSQDFDPVAAIGQVAEVFNDNLLLYASEPTSPRSWSTNEIVLRIGDVPSSDLREFATMLWAKLWHAHPPAIRELGNGQVRMPRDLAAETLFKLVRVHDLRRDLYELEEKLTSLDVDAFTRSLNRRFPGFDSRREITFLSSNGFRESLEASQASVWDRDLNPLETHDTHVRIVFRCLPRSRDPRDPQGGPADPPNFEFPGSDRIGSSCTDHERGRSMLLADRWFTLVPCPEEPLFSKLSRVEKPDDVRIIVSGLRRNSGLGRNFETTNLIIENLELTPDPYKILDLSARLLGPLFGSDLEIADVITPVLTRRGDVLAGHPMVNYLADLLEYCIDDLRPQMQGSLESIAFWLKRCRRDGLYAKNVVRTAGNPLILAADSAARLAYAGSSRNLFFAVQRHFRERGSDYHLQDLASVVSMHKVWHNDPLLQGPSANIRKTLTAALETVTFPGDTRNDIVQALDY